jgi:hypothetical protein
MYSGNDQGGVLSVSYNPEKESERDFLGGRGVELVRAAVGIPDLAVEILDTLTWEMADWLADHFQQGRIFLAGDSAHVMPPTGGYGANTGIADAHNLAWKLAAIINGHAGSNLLTTYEAERRAAARLAVEQAFLYYIERINPERAHQATAAKVANDIPIFGYLYHSAAVCSEDTDPYEDANFPTGRPGARAPHIALERAGKPLSTLDLFGRNFVLLTGTQGQMWREAAARLAPQHGLTLDTYGIGVDVIDVEGRFSSAYGVTATGATLVRPDGFIAWRAREAGEQPEQELNRVLRRVLCRP